MLDTRTRTLLCVSAMAILLTVPATPSGAQGPADLRWTLVSAGFDRPITVRHAGDGSSRLFVVEQSGRIRVITAAGQLLGAPFLDISTLVDSTQNEQGLLGLAFHPSYATNGRFFVSYTRDPGAGLDRSVIAEYRVSSGNPDIADPSSARTILELEQFASNHNGGNILFGLDGFLYIGLGDGGAYNDTSGPGNNAQTLSRLLGSFLRIDIDQPTPASGTADYCGINPNSAYRVPTGAGGNPFAGGSGDCDEIWTFGWRNPWRFSFDRRTGDILVGDVGQNSQEEVSFMAAGSAGGENFGWSCMEGFETPNFHACAAGPLEPPLLDYDHSSADPNIGSGNCAVTGGYRYRGSRIAGFDGVYVFGDFCTGRIWFATEGAPGSWSFSLWQDTGFSIASFGEDEAGEIYLTDFNSNAIYRLTSPSSIFTDGFESGDRSAWSASTP